MSLSGAKVLVTGADGFIGSHLVEELVREGAVVRALCCYNSNGSYGWLDGLDADVAASIDLRLGDVRDPQSVDLAVDGTDVVFHLAALIAIPYSYEAPASFIETNVMGTLHILEAARRHNVRRVVHTSTSEVYGTPDTVPITEEHKLKGQSPYSASKIAADKLCEAWACSYGVPVAVLRPFNTYGPRQSARAVIPTVLSQMLAGAPRIRLGSLAPKRDFTFVADTVRGFQLAAVADLDPGEVVHLGTGRTISIAELVSVAARVVGADVAIEEDDQRKRPADSEVDVLQSDPSRASARLGWTAEVELEEGLARTAEWLRPRADPATAARYHR